MFRLNITLLIASFLFVPSVYSNEEFSNFKKYNLTETQFKLEVITKPFDHPWALTFVDEKHLIVTEKN